jgi:hypothetical protein
LPPAPWAPGRRLTKRVGELNWLINQSHRSGREGLSHDTVESDKTQATCRLVGPAMLRVYCVFDARQ